MHFSKVFGIVNFEKSKFKNAKVLYVLGFLIKVKSLKFQLSLTSISLTIFQIKILHFALSIYMRPKMKNDLITLVL